MQNKSNIYYQLNKWYHNQLGQIVLLAERYELEKVLPHFFGYYLVQLGGPEELDWLKTSPIKHHIQINPMVKKSVENSVIQSLFSDLPFLSESIDAILLPHLLDFIEKPFSILQESVRVLIPDGHIIILGFNPVSLWGMWWLAKHKRDRIPWQGHFHRIGLVRHWLNQLDCEVDNLETFFFRPPLADLEKRKQLRMCEVIGQSCFPWLGGLYMITARKRQVGMHPIKLRHYKSPILSTNIATTGNIERGKLC